MKKSLITLVVLGVCGIALLLRAYGLTSQPPFWVDEFSSGTQARLVQEHGIQLLFDPQLRKEVYFEHHNIPAHVLIAGSFALFGESEWAARVPFVIIGSSVPLLLYLLLAGQGAVLAGVVAAALSAHVHMQILWSVQARGYMLLQACIIGVFVLYGRLLRDKDSKNLPRHTLLITLVSIIGLLSHATFVFVIAALILHSFVYYAGYKRSPIVWAGLTILVLLVAWMSGTIGVLVTFAKSTFTPVNNIWYYHSFLWREYTLVTFLGVFGLVRLYQQHKTFMQPIFLFIALYVTFILFIFGHHMTKYLLPVLPFLLAGMAYSIVEMGMICTKNARWAVVATFIITYAIILNGNIFVSKPKPYYSLNTHFREISNIDHTQVYTLITSKADKDTAIIETWPGRALWYLGNDFGNLYLHRWENEEGYANGHEKKTSFEVVNGMKTVTPEIGFVSTVDDLEKVMSKHATGFIFIDDDTLPKGVREYAEQSLHKELFLDHYTLDPNPYSIWPATLYSWGFQTK